MMFLRRSSLHCRRALVRLVWTAGGGLFVVSGSALAAPQLDLPKKRKETPQEVPVKGPDEKPGKGDQGEAGKKPVTGEPGPSGATGDVAGRKVGTTHKVEVVLDDEGRPIGTRTTDRENVPGATGGQKRSGALQLPDQTPTTGEGADDAATADEVAHDRVLEPVPDPFGDLPSSRTAARFLYEQLARHRRPNDDSVREIADRLARIGEDGLTVARFALGRDDAVQAFAGARALLVGGTADDADRVVRLLRGTPPKGSGHLILGELIERDPVRSNVLFLCDVLRNGDTQMRRIAERALRERLTPADLPSLQPALVDRSSEVRRAATELLRDVEGPEALQLMLAQLTDRSPSVARIAIETLARSDDETVDFELMRRAFARDPLRRDEALAIVAIAEREDLASREIFGMQHAPPMLEALSSESMLVRSAAALGLAGIGFRSSDDRGTTWLDGPVVAGLIDVASGAGFFDGFDILRAPAARRLRLVTGVSHGSDGPAWAQWWNDNMETFRAHRAVITVVPGDERRLVVRVAPGGGEAPFVLAGSELAADPANYEDEVERLSTVRGVAGPPAVLFLEDRDAADLIAYLTESGVFGADRLPGPRGTFGTGGRSVEVSVGGRSKTFRFSQRRALPWFDRILVRTRGLRDRQAWQRFPEFNVHATSRELFLAESAWWQADRSEEERAARMKELLLRHLDAAPPVERDLGISELTAMVEDGRTTLTAEDVEPLIELIGEESQFGARAQGLTMLVRRAGGMAHEEDGSLAPASRETNERLLALLHDRFGPFALDALVALLHDAGRDVILSSAVDESAVLRVAAALTLGEGADEDDVDLLSGMLRDTDEDVQVAVLQALGMRRATAASDRIHAAATSSSSKVRAAALIATGQVGGEGAVDVLVRGLTDPDQRNHLPAAEGLARLETTETAPLLVSLLRGGKRPAIQAVAREGLLRLGEIAHDELFAAMRSPDVGLRRDAALLLARQMEPRSVPVLASVLSTERGDERVAAELAVLTCVDYRGEPLPADRWFQWWDEVERNDSFSWFVAALEQRGIRTPVASGFAGGGTDEARLFLLTVMREVADPVRERARRELERLVGETLPPIPSTDDGADEWFVTTRRLALPDESLPDDSPQDESD